MANEHLQRNPTASGNRSTYTWSGWIKRTIIGNWERLFSTTGQTMVQFTGSGPQDQLRYFSTLSGSNFDLRTSALFRDVGSWMHVVFSANHTLQHSKDRVRMYINGAELDNYATDSSSNGSQNLQTYFNDTIEHALLGREDSSPGENFQGEAFDIFWVDGQALTPDVFGFYKDGDGYESSGTSTATDFGPGQWSPRLPKSIKHTINRSGGFGVNGFYLPLNDSSNPGADFHCTPNTIVKLKGEDEPQPRNGAPTTSDSFVSQLREEKGSEDLPFEGVVRFGGDGTSSSLKFPDHSDLDLGGSPFTAECWIYPQDTSGAGYGALFNKGFALQVYWKDDIEALQLFVSGDGSNYNVINGVTSQNGSVPKGRWTHIAVVREPGNNTWKMFTNGKLTYGPLNVSGSAHNNTNVWAIGDYSPAPGTYEFKGFVSDFRLVNGTAVYTAPFTPPTTRLTNITNTKLLCCQSSTNVTEAAVAPTTGGTAGGAETFATKNEITGSVVLAVPFISHLIGSNKITNGTFDTVSDGQDGYDNGDGTIDGWQKNGNSSLSINGNALRFTQTASGSWQGGNAAYAMGSEFVVGKTYSVRYRIRSSGNGNYSQGVGARIQKGSSWHSSNTAYSRDSNSDPGTSWTTVQWTWKAEQDNYGLEFFNWYGVQNSWIEIDDVEVYEQDTIRDYSADIRGGGTNKTVDVKNKFDVIDCPSHYGSALDCNPVADSYVEVAANAEFAYLYDMDHTIEFWYKHDTWDGSYLPHASIIGLKSGTDVAWRCAFTDKNTSEDGIQLYGTNGFSTGAQTLNNDWNHCAIEQYTSNGVTRTTAYINGIAAGLGNGPVGYDAHKNSTGPIVIGTDPRSANLGDTYSFNGQIQDVRIYKGVAKYKGGFDVAKPYTPKQGTPVGFESWRTTLDTSKNNFPTWNYLQSSMPLTEGSLTCTGSSNSQESYSTVGITTGKWYVEARTNSGVYNHFGLRASSLAEYDSAYRLIARDDGNVYGHTSQGQVGTLSDNYNQVGDIVAMAIDGDNGQVTFYINGVNVGGPYSIYQYSSAPTPYKVYNLVNSGNSLTINFGQNPSFCGTVTAGTNTDSNGKGLFKYAPPSGYLALCTDNLPTPAIADPGKHFKAVIWSGDGKQGRQITNVGFKPDLVWIKERSSTSTHAVFDSVRGAGLRLVTSTTAAEDAGAEMLYNPSFNNDGFTVGNDGATNQNGQTYVAWCWKASGSPAVRNNEGSVASYVSANTDAGFSIVKYAGNSSSSTTIGHGLNQPPELFILKSRDNVEEWRVYHTVGDGSYDFLYLNTDGTKIDSGYALPTTSVFNKADDNNENMIAYCWHSVPGYSKIGSYQGNNSTSGPFLDCGFKPAWVLIKSNTAASGNWILYDSSRSPKNVNGLRLGANLGDSENQDNSNLGTATDEGIDMLSNGFRIRTVGPNHNTDGETYIFMAFAESPYKTANAK